jgi:ketopantoate reductase
MRTLVVGASAIGGYFSDRLLEIDRDVTFLVRSRSKKDIGISQKLWRFFLGAEYGILF